jgi:hypothetical protein
MTDTPNTPEPPPKPNASTPVTTDPPADPAETMYRELEPGEWFLRPEFDQTPRVKTHRGHMCPKWLGAREKEELPVRRLTPAEVAEHFADLAGGSFVAHEEPEFFVGHSGGSPTACLGFTDEDGEEREHVVSVHEARGLAAQLSAWLATLPAQRDTKPTEDRSKPAPGWTIERRARPRWLQQLGRPLFWWLAERGPMRWSFDSEPQAIAFTWDQHDAAKGGAA